MKLLHVALIVDNSPQQALRDALAGIASEYREYDWCAARERGEDTSAGILSAAYDFQPDVTFMQLQDPTVLMAADAAAISGKRIQWTGDVRQPLPSWYWNLGSMIDLSLFSNEVDPQVAASYGAKTAYMDIGFDNQIFTPSGHRDVLWPEVVFLGGNYGDTFPLGGYRREMVDRLYSYFGSRFEAYGPGQRNPLIRLDQEAECLRSCKIAINLSHYDLERYSSDRLLRSLGCGPLVLTHKYSGLDKDWRDGTDLVGWGDIDELIGQINFFLHPINESTRISIAETGCAKAHREHTWKYRIENELLPMINNL